MVVSSEVPDESWEDELRRIGESSCLVIIGWKTVGEGEKEDEGVEKIGLKVPFTVVGVACLR